MGQEAVRLGRVNAGPWFPFPSTGVSQILIYGRLSHPESQYTFKTGKLGLSLV